MTREEALKIWLPVIKMGVESMPECSEALDMAIEALQNPNKSEWQHDHEILKAYSDGASAVLDNVRAEIEQIARPNEIGGRGNGKSIRYGLCMALEIIDKYMAEENGGNKKGEF